MRTIRDEFSIVCQATANVFCSAKQQK